MKEMKRAILNDVLSRRIGAPLYHYTTQRGLLGIIKKKEIWATHTQYLNDRREFLHALDLVREEIREARETLPEGPRMMCLQNMYNALDGEIQGTNVCVCSFSENSDSLAQWRAYGTSTSSFAIGLPGDLVAAFAEKMQWYLAPCIYDPSTQRELVKGLVEEVLEENLEKEADPGCDEDDRLILKLGGNLVPYLLRYAPILKDRSFQEEREWRIISRPVGLGSKSFDFREGTSLLIPYFKFPLDREDLHLTVHEVVVGPTPDGDRSRLSVKNFLFAQGLKNVPVTLSSVPYRSW